MFLYQDTGWKWWYHFHRWNPVSWLQFISGSYCLVFLFSVIILCLCVYTLLSMCHCLHLTEWCQKESLVSCHHVRLTVFMEHLLLCNSLPSSYVPNKEVNSCSLLCPKGSKKWRYFSSTSHHVGRGQWAVSKIHL